GIGRVDDVVGNACDPQPSLEFAAKRTQVRDREHTRKLEQLDGLMHGVGHKLDPCAARAAKLVRMEAGERSARCAHGIKSGRDAVCKGRLSHRWWRYDHAGARTPWYGSIHLLPPTRNQPSR